MCCHTCGHREERIVANTGVPDEKETTVPANVQTGRPVRGGAWFDWRIGSSRELSDRTWNRCSRFPN